MDPDAEDILDVHCKRWRELRSKAKLSVGAQIKASPDEYVPPLRGAHKKAEEEWLMTEMRGLNPREWNVYRVIYGRLAERHNQTLDLS